MKNYKTIPWPIKKFVNNLFSNAWDVFRSLGLERPNEEKDCQNLKKNAHFVKNCLNL